MQNGPPCILLKQTLPWPLAMVSFVCALQILSPLTTAGMAPSHSSTSVSQNKQAEAESQLSPPSFYPV